MTDQGLFDRLDAPTSDVSPRSTVGKLAGLGPVAPVNAADPYPRPWRFIWDAQVWRVMSANRTVVATCSDEKIAAWIVERGDEDGRAFR